MIIQGEIYEGYFKNDIPDGRGLVIRKNGDHYEGDLTDGMPYGEVIGNKFGESFKYYNSLDSRKYLYEGGNLVTEKFKQVSQDGEIEV